MQNLHRHELHDAQLHQSPPDFDYPDLFIVNNAAGALQISSGGIITGNREKGKERRSRRQEHDAAFPFASLCLLFRVRSCDFVDRSSSQSNERSTK